MALVKKGSKVEASVAEVKKPAVKAKAAKPAKAKKPEVAFKPVEKPAAVKNYSADPVENTAPKKPSQPKLPPRPKVEAAQQTKLHLNELVKKAVSSTPKAVDEPPAEPVAEAKPASVSASSLIAAPVVPKKSAPTKKPAAPGTISFLDLQAARNQQVPAAFDPTRFLKK